MNLRVSLLGLVVASFVVVPLFAQLGDPILLTNPSFEDMPRHSYAPIGWFDCGFPGESPPDIQPDPMRQFLVRKGAQHGNTYLGMVVRDNDTWERVSQVLTAPMQGGSCYEFSIYLARSEVYVSQSRVSDQRANYITPAKLRIYGGFDNCDKGQLLAESNVITNYRWLEFRFKLKPDQDYTHVMFEAFYNTPTLFPYNGNILLDNASAMRPIACDEDVFDPELIVAKEEPNELPTTPRAAPQNPASPQSYETPPTRPAQPQPRRLDPSTRLSQVNRKDLTVDQVFQIENITFKANSAELAPTSEAGLEELLGFLRNNNDVVVEVGGHTSGLASVSFAQTLSDDRAESVKSYLVQRGINYNRVVAKGYGRSRQIATNDTAEGRRKNQRVEVRIIGFLKS